MGRGLILIVMLVRFTSNITSIFQKWELHIVLYFKSLNCINMSHDKRLRLMRHTHFFLYETNFLLSIWMLLSIFSNPVLNVS